VIYEQRVYRAAPGRMPKLVARFRDHILAIWEKHGIRQVGFWTTLVGESSEELAYILSWVSPAEREAFYQRLGWRFDDDVAPTNDIRIVQFTPPGSGCSVTFGKGITAAAPGSAVGG